MKMFSSKLKGVMHVVGMFRCPFVFYWSYLCFVNQVFRPYGNIGIFIAEPMSCRCGS